MATKAGIQSDLKGDRLQRRGEKTGHELHDLLKSTLIVSGTADYVCNLAIGHKVGDSYEKQDELYPERSRSEFAKASKKLNIFSNISNFVNNGDDVEKYKSELEENLRNEMNERLQVQKTELYNIMQEKFSKQLGKFYDDLTKEHITNNERITNKRNDKEIQTKLKRQKVIQLVKKKGISNDILERFLLDSMKQRKSPFEAYTEFEMQLKQ